MGKDNSRWCTCPSPRRHQKHFHPKKGKGEKDKNGGAQRVKRTFMGVLCPEAKDCTKNEHGVPYEEGDLPDEKAYKKHHMNLYLSFTGKNTDEAMEVVDEKLDDVVDCVERSYDLDYQHGEGSSGQASVVEEELMGVDVGVSPAVEAEGHEPSLPAETPETNPIVQEEENEVVEEVNDREGVSPAVAEGVEPSLPPLEDDHDDYESDGESVLNEGEDDASIAPLLPEENGAEIDGALGDLFVGEDGEWNHYLEVPSEHYGNSRFYAWYEVGEKRVDEAESGLRLRLTNAWGNFAGGCIRGRRNYYPVAGGVRTEGPLVARKVRWLGMSFGETKDFKSVDYFKEFNSFRGRYICVPMLEALMVEETLLTYNTIGMAGSVATTFDHAVNTYCANNFIEMFRKDPDVFEQTKAKYITIRLKMAADKAAAFGTPAVHLFRKAQP